MSYRIVKGHGTENDFVVVPGDVALTVERVRALCDRRAGIGGDGVIGAVQRDGRWFMDYRNADGSIAEMCGNGIRVFARYLQEYEGVSFPLEIDTRDGIKTLTATRDGFSADLGAPKIVGMTRVAAADGSWPAVHIDMGNPHAVAFVDSLDDAGGLLEAPAYDESVYPDGVNVEFVQRVGPRHVAMRVYERGAGETRSCGTGAAAVMVAAARADDLDPSGSRQGLGIDTPYVVDVPGGRLQATWTADDRVLLAGPAVLVAWGETDL